MTRSIFDPTGGETEHSGSQNLGPDASQISHMPPDIVDGVVDCDEAKATVDMSLLQPRAFAKPQMPGDPFAQPDEADAPQEPDTMDDPTSLIEGQINDESDAPQD